MRRTIDAALVHRAERAGLVSTHLHDAELDLHYYRSADPPSARPLLVLHGFGGDGLSNWAGQLASLTASRPVLLPDLLWFGQSTSTAPPSLEVQVEAMMALLDHESIPKVDILAISYGGFVAFGMLELDPDRIGRLMLVDTPGPLFSASDITQLVQRHGVTRPEELFVTDGPEELQQLFAAVMVKPPSMSRRMWRAIHAQWFSANHPQQRDLLADLPRQRMLLDHLPIDTLDVPLVIWGVDDQIFPLAAGEALADSLNAHLAVIHGAAHAPNFEQKRVFNQVVQAWLEAPSPEPGRTEHHP